jgi:hypothetical protein
MRELGLSLGLCVCTFMFAGGCKQPAQTQAAAPQPGATPVTSSAKVSSTPLASSQPLHSAAQQGTTEPAIQTSPGKQTPNADSPLLEDVETHEGPFQISGQDYTVWSHTKRIKGKTGGDNEALTSLEIRDASGAVAYREPFSYEFEGGAFNESCTASADILSGSMTKWLLISSFCLPDAPGYSGPLQVFGVENGKLVPWGKPIDTQGEFVRFVPGTVSKSETTKSFGFDAIEFKVWTGYFFVTVPVRIDLAESKLEPGARCFRQTGRGMAESGCEVPVEATRHPGSDDETFVRLFSEPTENSSSPSHAVIRKDSKVEFLAASAQIVLDDSGNAIDLKVAGDALVEGPDRRQNRLDSHPGRLHRRWVASGRVKSRPQDSRARGSQSTNRRLAYSNPCLKRASRIFGGAGSKREVECKP